MDELPHSIKWLAVKLILILMGTIVGFSPSLIKPTEAHAPIDSPIKAIIESRVYNPYFQFTEKLKIKYFILSESEKMGLSYEDFRKLRAVAFYESSFRHNVYGDNGKSFGVYQFRPNTFYWLARKYNLKLNYMDLKDQIKLTIRAYKDGKMKLWSGWRVAKIKGFNY